MKRIIIAIDGYSSCGKSTMAKDLAKEIGYTYIDTGAMYRAVTLYAIRKGLIDNTAALEKELPNIRITFKLDPVKGTPRTQLNGEDVEDEIRNMEVSSHVSAIATLGFVRTFLVKQQQDMGKQKGIVMDGRDIGTVVFPDAEIKIFVTASDAIRATRRYDELEAKGENADYMEILKNVQERDYIDTHREIAPLRKTPDAIELDNTSLTREEQKIWLLHQYHRIVDHDNSRD